MPISWVISFNLKPGKTMEYKNFVNSDEARRIHDEIEKKTVVKYANTYFGIIPSPGDFDVHDVWELPNLAAFDKARETNALEEELRRTYDMIDWTKPVKHMLLRTAKEVKIIYEPPK